MKPWVLALGAVGVLGAGAGALAWTRRSRSALDGTVRTGPRTGAVHVDERDVQRVARKLIRGFHPRAVGCGRESNALGPAYARVRGVQIRMPTGDVKTIDVEVMPAAANGGSYSPSASQIRVFARELTCATRDQWLATVSTTLRHEFAHVADPATDRLRHRGGTGPAFNQTKCVYLNDPREINARLAEMRSELESNRDLLAHDKRRGETFTAADMRIYSDTFTAVDTCLTPKNRRRFLKVAARFRESL